MLTKESDIFYFIHISRAFIEIARFVVTNFLGFFIQSSLDRDGMEEVLNLSSQKDYDTQD